MKGELKPHTIYKAMCTNWPKYNLSKIGLVQRAIPYCKVTVRSNNNIVIFVKRSDNVAIFHK